MPPPSHEELRKATAEAIRAIAADSVYFFLADGWRHELRGNRWHWISRWARHLPVVILQNERSRRRHEPRVSRDDRLGGATLAYVPDPTLAETLAGFRCAKAIQSLQNDLGHRSPILWLYDPTYIIPFGALPARARVYHATENYFNFSCVLPESFLAAVRAVVTSSDLTLAVSEGVGESLRKEAGKAHVEVITNGCDAVAYSTGRAVQAFGASQGYSAVAVYAGNINSRIDFQLLNRAATSYPDVLFALYGPVANLAETDSKEWERLLSRANVKYFGAVDADRLPDIYASADVGLIPYRTESYLVDNGFPLKTLEMAAAGLPVVSSYMRPIVGLADAIAVVPDAARFIEAIALLRRTTLTGAQRAQLLSVAYDNDYDRKFAAAVSKLRSTIQGAPSRSTKFDELTEGGVIDLIDFVQKFQPLFPSRHELIRFMMTWYTKNGPSWIGRTIPARVKSKLLSYLGH